jgi:hypothetical protein
LRKFFILLLAVFLFFCTIPAYGASDGASDFVFDAGTIIEYTGSGGDVVIPSEINGVRVEEIGNWAFAHSKIKSVTMPDDVVVIGRFAFYCCENLTEVRLSQYTNVIGRAAFSGCSNLKNIEIPINERAFGHYGYSLKIGEAAFNACVNLNDLIISETTGKVGNRAFEYCDNLKTITFDNPKTIIVDHVNTIPPQAVIKGFTGSTAEAYAEKYNRTFETLGTYTDTPITGIDPGITPIDWALPEPFSITNTDIYTGQAVLISLDACEGPVILNVDQKIKIEDIHPLFHIQLSEENGIYPNYKADFMFIEDEVKHTYAVKDEGVMQDVQCIIISPSEAGTYKLNFTINGDEKYEEVITVKKGNGSYKLSDSFVQLSCGIGLMSEEEVFGPGGIGDPQMDKHIYSFQQEDYEQAKKLILRRLEDQSGPVERPWRSYNPKIRFHSAIDGTVHEKIITKLDQYGEGVAYFDIPIQEIRPKTVKAYIETNLWYSPDEIFYFMWGINTPALDSFLETTDPDGTVHGILTSNTTLEKLKDKKDNEDIQLDIVEIFWEKGRYPFLVFGLALILLFILRRRRKEEETE